MVERYWTAPHILKKKKEKILLRSLSSLHKQSVAPSKQMSSPIADGARLRRAASSIPAAAPASARPVTAPRFIQHKKEALWFYRFISIGYDRVFNPEQYTEDMRDDALEPAGLLYSRHLKVVDVGGGTGFTTLGIAKHVDPENITLLDQSPDQLQKARQKEALKEVTIMEGDAEDLPFPTDSFDRYVSAGRSLFSSPSSLLLDTTCCAYCEYVPNKRCCDELMIAATQVISPHRIRSRIGQSLG